MVGEPGSVSELMAAASSVSQSPPGNVLRDDLEKSLWGRLRLAQELTRLLCYRARQSLFKATVGLSSPPGKSGVKGLLGWREHRAELGHTG